MNTQPPENNPYSVPSSTAPADPSSTAKRPHSLQQRVKRALFLVAFCTVAGIVFGFGLWWLTTTVWSLFESWWWPAVSRRSGGDPIDNWARGITRMFFMLTFVIPTGAVGFGIGIRLALSQAVTRQEYLAELRRCRNDAVRVIFGPKNHYGNISCLASVGVLIVLDAGFRARNLIPVTLAIPTVLLLITVGFYTGVKGIRRKPLTTALFGLCLSAYGSFLFVSAVCKMGLEGLLEEWL